MLELRLIKKKGKCGECAVWGKVISVYINNDLITFNLDGESDTMYFIETDKLESIKVVKK